MPASRTQNVLVFFNRSFESRAQAMELQHSIARVIHDGHEVPMPEAKVADKLGSCSIAIRVKEESETLEAGAKGLSKEAENASAPKAVKMSRPSGAFADAKGNDEAQDNDSEMEGDDGDEDLQDLRSHMEAQLLSAEPLFARCGRTALHRAAGRGLGEAVAPLLAACPSLINQFILSEEDERITALHCAVFEDRAAIVTQLLAVSPTLINGIDDWPLVQWAAREGHATIMAQFLAANPALLERATDEGWTDLLQAVCAGQAELVAQLLAADPASIDAVAIEGWNALHWAASGGYAAIVTQLLAAKPTLIDAVTHDLMTALHCAARMGREEVVAQLLPLSPALVEAKTVLDWTALDWAAENGNEGVVAQLLTAKPDLIDESTSDGSTALHFAALRGHKGVVAQLLAAKPDLIDAVTCTNMTALHCAVEGGHAEVAGQLLALSPTSVHVPLDCGWTVLHSAALGRHALILSQLLAATEEGDFEELLLRRCAKNVFVKEGSTALHVAASSGARKVVARLLAACPTLVDILDEENQTCLHHAALGPDGSIVAMLLDFKPDLVHQVDAKGNTALHSMVLEGQDSKKLQRPELIERVWRMNPAALYAVNKDRDTPLHNAIVSFNEGAIDVLQWGLTFDQVASAYKKHARSYVGRLKPLVELQCEELFVMLIPDVVAVVFNYLGL